MCLSLLGPCGENILSHEEQNGDLDVDRAQKWKNKSLYIQKYKVTTEWGWVHARKLDNLTKCH